MGFDLRRLRRGEWLVALSAVVLLVSMFALSWFGSIGPTSGWDVLIHERWFILLTIVVALALVVTQATRRSPAVPVSLSVIVFVIALINLAWLFYRVVISVPADQQAGAWIGLVSAAGIVVGAFLSMRQEGISERDAPSEIEKVDL